MADPGPASYSDSDGLDLNDPQDIATYWQIEIGLARDDHREFRDDGRKVYDRYRSMRVGVGRRSTSRRYNILYGNTETLRASLYGKTAKPDVRRRFANPDPNARSAADIIERALIYFTDQTDASNPIDRAVLDYLLPGRGVVRVEYEPIIGQRPQMDMMTGTPVINDDGEAETEEFIADQQIRDKYVFWEDFLCAPARNWDGVWWIAFRHTMSRDELRDEIFKDAPPTSIVPGNPDEVPLNWSPDLTATKKIPQHLMKAEVWEIWCKPKRKRYWVVDGYRLPLRIDEDPYGLDEFWPMPEPPVSYGTTDTIVPQAEFAAYRDQADDLDEINTRISKLTRALKRRGVYDQSIAELKRLAKADDNEFIPVENMANLTGKGGLEGVFQTEDISVVASTLLELYKQSSLLIEAIYQITGIADILRGASDPDETFGAQKIKAQFGSQRLKKRQRTIQQWIKNLYRIKAELILKHFQPDVLSEITGVLVTPEIAALLTQEKQRSYRVDIETDSTNFDDSAAMQAERSQMLEALTQFVVAWGPIIQNRPEMAPLGFEAITWAVRAFPNSRELEEQIEETKGKLLQVLAQAQQNPQQANPALQVAQTQAQTAQLKAQAEQTKAQAAVQTAQIEAASDQQRSNADVQIAQLDVQGQRDMHAQNLQQSAQQHAMKMDQAEQQAASRMTGAAGPAGGAAAPAQAASPGPRPIGPTFRAPADMSAFTPPRRHPNGRAYVQHRQTGQHFELRP